MSPTIAPRGQESHAGPVEHFNIVIVGHVDHGKSTLLGRLYADTGSFPDDHVERIREVCRQQGKEFEYAFLFDAFLEEQEQGITIDTARTFFKWRNREYILIDAPGHKEFLKNMISGASRAEGALLLIDANEGVQEQSKRHGYMLSLLGIPQVTVAVNKMDLVGYSQEVFDRIEAEYREFLASIHVVPGHVIPVSAREGDNIVERSGPMAWYQGPTVLDALAEFHKETTAEKKPFRMAVQDVYKFDERRIIVGRVSSGRLKVGDRVVFSPSNKTARVRRIEQFNAETLPTEARSGLSVGFTLDEQIFVERGEIAHHEDSLPLRSDLLHANLFWMGRQPMEVGKTYTLRVANKEVEASIARIIRIIDASDLAAAPEAKARIDRHDVAEVVLKTKRPIAFDNYTDFAYTGRFVIIDDYDIWGGGIISGAAEDALSALRERARVRDIAWIRGKVSVDDRERSNGHRAAMVLFSGDAGVGKALIAAELEARLHAKGVQAYLLDGANLRLGLDQDMDIDQAELERQFGEVSHILLRAGQLVISTTNAFSLADAAFLRPVVEPQPFLRVHISGSSNEVAPGDTDLHLVGIEDASLAVDRVMDLLESEAILSKRT